MANKLLTQADWDELYRLNKKYITLFSMSEEEIREYLDYQILFEGNEMTRTEFEGYRQNEAGVIKAKINSIIKKYAYRKSKIT